MDEFLEKIDHRLSDMQTILSEVRAFQNAQHRRLERLENEIWGNGRAGLAPKVNTLIYGVSIVGSMVGLVLAESIVRWFRG